MAASYPHLNPATVALLEASVDEKIAYLRQDAYIGYSAAELILKELQDVLSYPPTLRPPCRAVVSDSNNGKTSLTLELMRRNPVVLDESDYPIAKVIWMETPSEPDEGRFFSALLQSMSIAHRADAAPERLEAMVDDAFAIRRTSAVVLDEFHGMLNGTARNQKQFMAAVKRFTNRRQLSIIVSGTQDVSRALATDMQFVTRFQKLALPKWSPNEDYARLLTSFEARMPLSLPSVLTSPKLARLIFANSLATIGGIKSIIQAAAVEAIKANEERITYKILESVCAGLKANKL